MTESSRFRWHNPGEEISPADLVRECGRKLTSAVLWQKFLERFHKQITVYVVRTLWRRQGTADADLVCDLVQDVYLRLIENSGRVLRNFRGETEFSALAFLGRTAMGVVSDYYRAQQATKRQVEIVPIEDARRIEEEENVVQDLDLTAILSWIDVHRLMETESDRRNAARNVLIFKLHYVDGLTVADIARYPAFNLTERAIEIILHNTRTQLQRRLGR